MHPRRLMHGLEPVTPGMKGADRQPEFGRQHRFGRKDPQTEFDRRREVFTVVRG